MTPEGVLAGTGHSQIQNRPASKVIAQPPNYNLSSGWGAATGRERVTVCIAAVCENGKKIVVAADRMFTFPAPLNIEFQTPEKKIEQLGTTCVVLSSGNGAYSSEILRVAAAMLDGNPNPPISRAAEIIKGAFLTVRAAKVREQVVAAALGPDFLKFEAMNVPLPQYLQYQPNMFQQITVQMQMFNLGVDMIVAGIDTEGARVGYVGNPGTLAWLDKLGYAASGSGGMHATTRLSLGSQTRESGLAETVYRVYEAKKAAEVAPGVGTETDLAIVEADAIKPCGSATLTKLQDFFNARRDTMAPDLAELAALLSPREG